MLRLEYPRTATDLVTNALANNESVELPNPPAWIRQMAGMYRQAQRDLLQYRRLLGEAYDRNSVQIQTIERNYDALTEAVRYLYQQAQADQSASQDWVQTELIQVANAARDFTTDVWQEMATHAEDVPRANHYQAVQLTRLDDALALLQSANHHRNQQQAAFQSNVENWAARQEHTTTQLAAEQRRLATELAATQAALQQQEAEGGSGNRPPPPPPRGPRVASSACPPEGERRIPEDPETLEQLIARTVAAAVAGAHAAAPPGAPQRGQGEAMLTARFKMRDPGEFDGKPKSDFRSWWRMVEAYFRCYPNTLDAQRIAWVGSLLTNEAREWHLARELRTRLQDTWNAYSEAIQEQYLDPEEASTAYDTLAALRYKGDIKAYLVTLEALNHQAQITGQPLRKMVDLALPSEIISMRFNQNPRPLLEDGPFLSATYEAGRHYESLKKLMQQKATFNKDHSGSNAGASKLGPNKVSSKEGTTDAVPKVPVPGNGKKIYASWKDALAGVPAADLAAHKAAKASCFRCGRDNHHSTECYARTTTGGSALPPTPGTISAAEVRKRKASDPVGAPDVKIVRTTAAAIQQEGEKEREVPMWQQDSEDEDF